MTKISSTPDLVGELIYGSPQRHKMLVAIASEYGINGSFSMTAKSIANILDLPLTRSHAHLNLLAEAGLLTKGERERNYMGKATGQVFSFANSPAWNVVGATIRATDPNTITPIVEPSTLDVNLALLVQKTLFVRQFRPLIGMYLAGLTPNEQPINSSAFFTNNVQRIEKIQAAKTFKDFIRLGMAKEVEAYSEESGISIVTTSCPLHDIFRATSEIVPPTLQIYRLGTEVCGRESPILAL